jgi:HD-like signal output (HDOD) protein
MQVAEKKSRIILALEQIRNLPSIPKVMFEVTNILKHEPVNNIRLSETISKDQGLTTKVLSIANSPLYGLQRKVSSLEFAILLLGGEEIGSIVTAVSLADAIRFNTSANFRYMDYWKHSMLVAISSRDIARRLGMNEISGDAFLAGMLHDLGFQLLIRYFPNEYSKILVLVENGDPDFLAAENAVLGITHQEMGRFLAQKWGLPESLCDVLEFHHNPEKSKQNPLLVSIIHLADCMTQEFKIGDTFWDKSISFHTYVSEVLGFESLEQLADFTSEYKDVFADTADSIIL